MSLARLIISLGGVVQGVGFRPFIHRLAHELQLGGWVQNRSGIVSILVEGPEEILEVFLQRIQSDAPPLADPHLQTRQQSSIGQAKKGFSILESHSDIHADIHLPPDTHLCEDCRRELFDPNNRRYRYPFINCTQCGPRYTLIDSLPYDRARTSMAEFDLCPECRAEYEDPSNRRFHAEPVACPTCGPRLQWQDLFGEAALQAALESLRAGKIIAVKGVGGYHLMCDARNSDSVERLRQRKHRPYKPFAVLFDEVGKHGDTALCEYLQPTPSELTLLRSPQRPIVLIRMLSSCRLAPGVAPGMRRIGAMLPHSPLQALLAHDFNAPLIATSGNLSGEPIAIDAEDAELRLGNIAEGFLHHNRRILRPAEDSVWQVQDRHPLPIRLGRGDAAQEWRLATPLKRPTLALGGEQKVCIALGWKDRVVVSPHIGDMNHPHSLVWLEQVAQDLCRLYQVEPECLAIDAHPGYQSRRWAESRKLPLHEVWHHHAHASALCAEHPHTEDWVIFAWDGVGLGPDGSLWGGEVLRGRPNHWKRIGRLRPFSLPGGEAASRECWRSAAGLLWETNHSARDWHPQMEILHQAWLHHLNSPRTSAVGRLFDAAAALTDVCSVASFEGEGPMRLQALAESRQEAPTWPVTWRKESDLWELDWAPWLGLLCNTAYPVEERARGLHLALANSIKHFCDQIGLTHQTSIGGVGGVFQNTLLIQMIRDSGVPLQVSGRQPANDGGLALGQLVELATRNS